MPPEDERTCMTWQEIGELVELGSHLRAYTYTHPNLSQLSTQDPSDEKRRGEFDTCDGLLKKHLGITPRDFAFTGTSWSSIAEKLAMQRYRFGRLWIIQSTCEVDGNHMRYAKLVGIDGGPPMAARHITRQSPRCRLPSMEIQGLIREPEAFRRYLEGTLES